MTKVYIMENPALNLLFIGKTGAGKSSLINYLLQNTIRETGTGHPVTEKGFHLAQGKINNLPVNCYDSWGLEPDKRAVWKQSLENILAEKQKASSFSLCWHCIVYCFDVGRARVEESELALIQELKAQLLPVIIVFTKADLSADSTLVRLKEIVHDQLGQNIPTISLCSEEKVLLGGIKSRAFGRDELIQSIFKHSESGTLARLPDFCLAKYEEKRVAWHDKFKAKLKQVATKPAPTTDALTPYTFCETACSMAQELMKADWIEHEFNAAFALLGKTIPSEQQYSGLSKASTTLPSNPYTTKNENFTGKKLEKVAHTLAATKWLNNKIAQHTAQKSCKEYLERLNQEVLYHIKKR